MKRCKYRGHCSIFVRLLLVLIVTMFTMHLIIAVIFGRLFNNNISDILEYNIGNYAEYIIRDIGSPPDTAKAVQYASEFEFQYQYEADDFFWSSDAEMPAISTAIENPRHKIPGPTSTWRQNFTYTHTDGSQALIRWTPGSFQDNHRKFFFMALAVVTFIFMISHGYTRHVLQPIRLLQKGVDEVREGNLDTKVPVVREDELGQLTETFNDMTRRIKEMLHSRDQLLLDVSHELRSPLTRMKVALELIPDNPRKNGILTDIKDIEIMITEILETERLKNGDQNLKQTSVPLSHFINNIVGGFQNRKPGIQIKPVPDNLYLQLDEERMKIVFNNLLENAIKFSRPESKPIQIQVSQDEDVMIQIIDDGIGIPAKEIPYLFEPFYRADRSRSKETGGYGLGLHICKKIVEAHGGKIGIKNNSKNGTTVIIHLLLHGPSVR